MCFVKISSVPPVHCFYFVSMIESYTEMCSDMIQMCKCQKKPNKTMVWCVQCNSMYTTRWFTAIKVDISIVKQSKIQLWGKIKAGSVCTVADFVVISVNFCSNCSAFYFKCQINAIELSVYLLFLSPSQCIVTTVCLSFVRCISACVYCH